MQTFGVNQILEHITNTKKNAAYSSFFFSGVHKNITIVTL